MKRFCSARLPIINIFTTKAHFNHIHFCKPSPSVRVIDTCEFLVDRWTPGGHATRQPERGQRPDDRSRASPVQSGHNAVQSGAVRPLRRVEKTLGRSVWRSCRSAKKTVTRESGRRSTSPRNKSSSGAVVTPSSRRLLQVPSSSPSSSSSSSSDFRRR